VEAMVLHAQAAQRHARQEAAGAIVKVRMGRTPLSNDQAESA